MTATPSWKDRLFFARRLPALSVSVALLFSAVFWLWQWQDSTRYADAADWYSSSGLYALEAENYLSHLAQTLQKEKADEVEDWHRHGKMAAVAMAIVADRDFAYFLDKTSGEFWGGSVYPKWRALHEQLNDKTRHFSRFKWGVSGADKRPLTFFTHGFLSYNAWHWCACFLMLLVIGGLIEGRIGGLALLILFTGGTAITGLIGLMGHWHSAMPRVGADGGISVLLGVYLWQYGLARRDLVFNVHLKGECRTLTVPLFGAYCALPWLIWTGVAWWLWQLPVQATLSGLVLGLACGWWLQKRLTAPVMAPVPSRPSDEGFRQAYDKALNRLSAFDFRGAETALQSLYEQYPHRGDVAERLFMLRHYRPHSADHQAWTESMLERLSNDPANLPNIEHVLDALAGESGAFPIAGALLEKLLISATQAQRYAFAADLAKAGSKQQLHSPLFIKGLRTLAQRLRMQDEALAQHFDQIARDLSATAGTPS